MVHIIGENRYKRLENLNANVCSATIGTYMFAYISHRPYFMFEIIVKLSSTSNLFMHTHCLCVCLVYVVVY